ncbi:hypothetical protein RhiirC2_74213 [Rhizophagus irregularis]|uniref:Uncharacterized protein n=1 Tax=Rhizophagus irregularis TaxID=588596 RepID=A0A2N1MUB5_9GLOM|nr:hypothetical protein RhiirC2_74213 [Rhizophagus irregularis]
MCMLIFLCTFTYKFVHNYMLIKNICAQKCTLNLHNCTLKKHTHTCILCTGILYHDNGLYLLILIFSLMNTFEIICNYRYR